MADVLTPTQFLGAPGLILDVRSPGEYEHGHIPGAICFPLFSNEERTQVGTCYKHRGREAAVELGLAIVGPKLVEFVSTAKQLVPDRHVRLHCWRGGMRSGSMAWLLETAGFKVGVLEGGYKAFRRWVRSTLAVPKPIITLGGMTGTGKTAILQELAHHGEQILDLEHWAHHRGSSYGALGLPAQPSTEQFENLLALAWADLKPDHPVWIEAESRMVGTCRIPDELFGPMRQAPIVQIERSQAERLQILLAVYGEADREALITATERIARRLGGQHAQVAVEAIRVGDLATAIEIVLTYYDKTYVYDLRQRQVPCYSVNLTGLNDREGAALLMTQAHTCLPELLGHTSVGGCS